jgi:hypothetical protein
MHTASQALAIERQASAQPSLAERVSRPKTRAILGLMRLNFLSVFLHYFFNVTKTQRVCHVPSHTKHHDFQRIMQSFKNLAEGTFDEAFAKIVHTKLYQIRLLRHNQFNLVAN